MHDTRPRIPETVLPTRPPRLPTDFVSSHRGPPRRGWLVLAVLGLVAFLLGSAGALVALSPHDHVRSPGVEQRLRPSPADALAIWNSWQERRSAAFAQGSVAQVRALYVRGAGAADVSLLEEYAARGLRIEHLTEQVLAARVVSRTDEEVTLVLVSRTIGAVAVSRAGRIPLPNGQPRQRSVTLRRTDGQWLAVTISASPQR